MDLSDYTFSSQTPTWCPGCGNYAVLSAVKKSLLELKIAPKDTVVTYDIGCGGNMVNNLSVCGFATLHGRSIPVAVGAKLANPDLTVIAQGGDGGLLNEGANHLIHAAQRNDNITVLLHNNQIFALTAGQTSSATPKNLSTKSTPSGSSCSPLNPLLLASSSGAGFLARAYAFDLEATTKIIKQAISYQGFSLVEIIMPCLIWTKEKADKMASQVFYPDNLPQDYGKLLNFLAKKKNNLALGVIWQK
jgi:2-oxoglutarate/2-oxoacid ferredoxin oxidoreductase subunit beta